MFKTIIKAIKGSNKELMTKSHTALEGVSAAVMMVDLEFNIIYINKAAKQLFIQHQDQFKTEFPQFDATKILGSSIDGFHPNPQQQRILLTDFTRLPLNTELKVGDLIIAQSITAMYDANSNFAGNLIEWLDITKEHNRSIKDIESAGQLTAITKSQGVVELSMEGKVIYANDKFLEMLGYNALEAIGQHHSAFVDAAHRISPEYRYLWEKLNRGECDAGVYKRIAKDGREVWIQASYNPILDSSGKPLKVVKYATDITQVRLQLADYQGQIEAISESQGVIEFSMDGIVINANTKFLTALGYSEQEVIGQHHSTFVDADYRGSSEYRYFWEKLNRGEYDSGVYKRIAKNGREIWIQASYNPILDLSGKPFKVVKYGTDITQERLKAADFEGQIAAISKVMGVIEFDLFGNILNVNDNFASVGGYHKNEIIGQHHSMFVDNIYRTSSEYKSFWERLARGEPESGQYRRVGKNGREIWLEASYNPIMDMSGKPFKVVKYATEITERIKASIALAKAVDETQTVVIAAKSGDLMKRIPMEDKDAAIHDLCSGVNSLIENMAEIITQIKEAGETINTAADEISSGNNDLSQRTEEQASSLEETASSMEELASTVKQNAENAKQANSMVLTASTVAVKGGEVVSQVVKTMSDISQSSKKIEEIISVIDGIAFQTNILALNAAVEAARAGEQGRGFAVVAGEVRNLAQRSAAAAKEIKQLISHSVGKVDAGTILVEQAGSTMEEVVNAVKRVTDIMGEITAASIEQSVGIDHVNTAITQMDEVTQQNAALVEQSAAAAESLADQSSQLMEKVSHFKVASDSKTTISQPSLRSNNSFNSSELNKPALKKSRSKIIKNASSNVQAIKNGTNNDGWAEF